MTLFYIVYYGNQLVLLDEITSIKVALAYVQCAADKFVHRFGLIVRVYGGTADFI